MCFMKTGLRAHRSLSLCCLYFEIAGMGPSSDSSCVVFKNLQFSNEISVEPSITSTCNKKSGCKPFNDSARAYTLYKWLKVEIVQKWFMDLHNLKSIICVQRNF